MDTNTKISTVFINHCDKIEIPGKKYFIVYKSAKAIQWREGFFFWLFIYLDIYFIIRFFLVISIEKINTSAFISQQTQRLTQNGLQS